jgi:hypothetical protein
MTPAQAVVMRRTPFPDKPVRPLPVGAGLSFHVEHELPDRGHLLQYCSILGIPALSVFL